MSADHTTKQRRRGRAKVALTLLGLGAGLIAVAFALGAVGSRPELADGDRLAGRDGSPLSIRVRPRSRTVAPGEITTQTVRIHNRGDRPVWLRVGKKTVPDGASASIRPHRTRRSRATLTIRTTVATPVGRYRPRVKARSGARHAKTTTRLIVALPPVHSFEITGSFSGPLSPGLTVPLDLTLANPDSSAISITGLQVGIALVTAPQADATYPCSADDFSITQFSGAYPFTLGAGATSNLSELGFSQGEWPQVTMLDRPVNQDGCKGSSLTLEYTGTSQGGTS